MSAIIDNFLLFVGWTYLLVGALSGEITTMLGGALIIMLVKHEDRKKDPNP